MKIVILYYEKIKLIGGLCFSTSFDYFFNISRSSYIHEPSDHRPIVPRLMNIRSNSRMGREGSDKYDYYNGSSDKRPMRTNDNTRMSVMIEELPEAMKMNATMRMSDIIKELHEAKDVQKQHVVDIQKWSE